MEEAEIPEIPQNKENQGQDPGSCTVGTSADSLESIFRITAETGCCLLPLILITYLALGLDTGLCRFLLGSDIVPRSQTALLSALLLERLFGSFSISAFLCPLL